MHTVCRDVMLSSLVQLIPAFIFTLMMETIDSMETVPFPQNTKCNAPEDHTLSTHHCEDLKS